MSSQGGEAAFDFGFNSALGCECLIHEWNTSRVCRVGGWLANQFLDPVCIRYVVCGAAASLHVCEHSPSLTFSFCELSSFTTSQSSSCVQKDFTSSQKQLNAIIPLLGQNLPIFLQRL